MKEVAGRLIATPASDHLVYELSDMIDGVLYPSTCFSKFQMPRGRKLIDALANDPLSPTGEKILNAVCYTKAQISDYLDSYSDSTSDVVAEVAAAMRVERNGLLSERERMNADQEQFRSDMRKEYAQKMDAFVEKFIGDYSRDITAAVSSTCGIYFLRKGASIVYVGQSVNVYIRASQHRATKDFDSVDFIPCPRERLDELEGFFIRLIRPSQNGYDAVTENGAPKSSIWGEVVSMPWSMF